MVILTKKEQEVLQVVMDLQGSDGCSNKAIADIIGFKNARTANQYIYTLIGKGMLEKVSHGFYKASRKGIGGDFIRSTHGSGKGQIYFQVFISKELKLKLQNLGKLQGCRTWNTILEEMHDLYIANQSKR